MKSVSSGTESGFVDHRIHDDGLAGDAPAPKKLDDAGVKALLGDDLVLARKTLNALSPADRLAVFNAPLGTTGQVPMLAAAARGSTQIMALFAGMGASLSAQTPAGFDGIYTALFNVKEDAARTLLKTKKLRDGMSETKPVTSSDVSLALSTLGKKPTDAELDAITDKLTTSGTKILTTTDTLAIYLAHMNDAKTSPFVAQAEAWNPEGALESRVRSLLGLIVKTPLGDERSALIREVAAECEAVRLDRRIYSIGQTKDPEVRKLALERECDRVLTKLKDAVDNGNIPLRTLIIPVATPQHTMFMSLGPCYINGEPHIVFHYDNRGAGHDIHTQPTDGKVFPLRTAVPATIEMYGLLRELLVNLLGQRGNGSVDGVYSGLKDWLTAITVEFGPNGVEDPSLRELPEYRQVAGNCSLANQEPGIERRLGTELALRFHSFEQTDVRRRLLASVTAERLDAWLTDTNAARNEEQKKIDAGAS